MFLAPRVGGVSSLAHLYTPLPDFRQSPSREWQRPKLGHPWAFPAFRETER